MYPFSVHLVVQSMRRLKEGRGRSKTCTKYINKRYCVISYSIYMIIEFTHICIHYK